MPPPAPPMPGCPGHLALASQADAFARAADDADRNRRYPEELVALAPDVILAAASNSVAALQRVTHSVPVVFAIAYVPTFCIFFPVSNVGEVKMVCSVDPVRRWIPFSVFRHNAKTNKFVFHYEICLEYLMISRVGAAAFGGPSGIGPVLGGSTYEQQGPHRDRR
jgi:hypothetical protein